MTRVHSEVGARVVIMTALVSVFFRLMPPGVLWLFPLLLLAWRTSGRAALASGLLSCGIFIGMLALGGGSGGELVGGAILVGASALAGAVFTSILVGGGGLSRAGFWAVVPWVLLAALVLLAGSTLGDGTLEQAWQQGVTEARTSLLEQLPKGETLQELEEVELTKRLLSDSQTWNWILYLVPASLGIMLGAMLWINLWLAVALDSALASVVALNRWRPPETWFLGLLAGMALTLAGKLLSSTILLAPGGNLLILTSGIYAVAGLSLLSFLGRFWGLLPWLMVSILIALTFPFSLGGLVLLGVADFWLDLRTRFGKDDPAAPLES